MQGLAPEHVIHMGTASKTLTPALRLGWVLAPARLIDALAREKHDDDLGSSLLEQLALARFIDSGAYARHLRRVRPVYEARRDAGTAALAATLPGAHWHGEAARPLDRDRLRLRTEPAIGRGVKVIATAMGEQLARRVGTGHVH